ncbi:MAG: hypothetical protein OEW00_08750 [candidate division Zixibacteria bacterium]|nr:hypothetical protein [candidate division Zixibacteria bacterium]
MLKNLLTAAFALKFLVWVVILVYDLSYPSTYVEIGADSSITVLFRAVAALLIVYFGLLTYGLLRSKRWVVYLYSTLLLILIVFVVRQVIMFALYETFGLPVLLGGAVLVLAVPVLIEIYLISIRKTALVR